MTTAAVDTLIIKDEAGNYYMLTRDMLESARLSSEEKAKIEQLVENPDVAGFAMAPATLQQTPLRLGGPAIRVMGTCRCTWSRLSQGVNPPR